MASINEVTVVGNLTRDPELRFTQAGLAVCNASVAVNRRWQNKTTQEWEEKVSYIDVTVWGVHGQNVAESLRKGDRVFVNGRLEQRSWEDDAGNKRSKEYCDFYSRNITTSCITFNQLRISIRHFTPHHYSFAWSFTNSIVSPLLFFTINT